MTWGRKSPGVPEAAGLLMLLGAVLPAWLSAGAGWLLAYCLAVAILGYVCLRECGPTRRE